MTLRLPGTAAVVARAGALWIASTTARLRFARESTASGGPGATVLGWDQHVQARQFAGMTLSTHGESQTRFSQVFNVLHRLYLVLDESGGADG